MWRLTKQSLKENWFKVCASLCCVLGYVYASTAIPLKVGDILDSNIKHRNIKSFVSQFSHFAFLILLVFIFLTLILRFANQLAGEVAHRLRKEQSEQLLNLSEEVLLAHKLTTGTLLSRLTSDTQIVNEILVRLFSDLPQYSMLFLATSLTMLKISPRLGGYLLVAFILLAIFLIVTFRYNLRNYRQWMEQIDQLNVTVKEDIVNVANIKSFVRREHVLQKFLHVAKQLYRAQGRSQRINLALMPCATIIIFFMQAVIVFGAGVSVLKGELTTGVVYTFLVYNFLALSSLLQIQFCLNQAGKGLVSAKRISNFLALKSLTKSKTRVIDSSSNVMDRAMDQLPLLTLENVSYSYPNSEEPVLQDINLQIYATEKIGIVGATGSGKSTLLKIVAGILQPTSGSLTWHIQAGENSAQNNSLFSKEISYVPQTNFLFSGDVESNLTLANDKASVEQMWQAIAKAELAPTLKNKQGLASEVQIAGANFSGGQKQRLCLARSFLKSASLLLLDDATSALDQVTERQVIANLNQRKQAEIRVTTRISSLVGCQRILVLDEGRIVAIGSHEELLVNCSLYAEMYQIQQGIA